MLKAQLWHRWAALVCIVCNTLAPDLFSEDLPVVPLWTSPSNALEVEDKYAREVSMSLTRCGKYLVTTSPKQIVCYDPVNGSVRWKRPYGENLYTVGYRQEGNGAARKDCVFIRGHVMQDNDKIVIVDSANIATWYDLAEGKTISRVVFPRAASAVFGGLMGPAVHGQTRISFSLKQSQVLLMDSFEHGKIEVFNASPYRVNTPPVAVSNEELYTGGNALLRFDVDSEEASIIYERPGHLVGMPRYDGDDNLYFVCGNRFVKYSVKENRVLWDVSPNENARVFPWVSPTLIEKCVIIASSSNKDMTVYCMDTINGNVLWQQKTENPSAGPPVKFGDYVVYAMISGKLCFYGFSTGFKAHVVKGGSGLSWYSSPLACSDGILYYANTDRLIAYSANHSEW